MIDNINFQELDAEKYWDYPKNYKGNKKEEIHNYIFSGDYAGAIKKDGHYFRFIKNEDGSMRLQSRTRNVEGDYINKIEWVPQLRPFFDRLPNGTCLLGEIYFPDKPGSRNITSIMGCNLDKALIRQDSTEYGKVYYWVFDVWAYDNHSLLNTSMQDRIATLKEIAKLNEEFCQYVKFAKYYTGEELWNVLQIARAKGEEGIVITSLTSHPEPGKRTKYKTLKVKKELDNEVDCFIGKQYKPATLEYTGKNIQDWKYWCNMRTQEKLLGEYYKEYLSGSPILPITKNYYNGWAGAIELCCMKDGKEFHIGWVSGVTEDIKRRIVEEPDTIYRKVVKANAMMIEQDTHAFRHCAITEFRDDIPYLDCTYEKIFGDV